ncbi:efflux RND transporter periplasmic adaptor subunit [Entomospira culicis]|uniref:HlyD family efflux transporter periplasmic adaptor subunit n=1 Tax=Entomospira culicis TaxID=2719989 RepID=A0A968GJV6_9SPIO|nr:efflux RND transporter periplasmic adaptor subunit [Entomospira culicis]NIZ18975.1 HlyD family efflux transporter periplasmic adaptor subunit [Entomospira culicis]NIZ69190.1 HlyD family efflux transporter periplasmic adaptor subunit [Entomospira culicis]WDI37776.1 efflux RND transporter periplasmic adaptor subunit [Entomospira culicis]WDI39404.1 efflux RND transporter periplasmic adaptor subunit [Entomospira culicis]
MMHNTNVNEVKTFRRSSSRSPMALIIILSIIVVAIVGIALYMLMNKNKSNEIIIERKVYSVATQEMQAQEIVDYFKINGDVIATNLINVFPDVQVGRLMSYSVKVGDKVSRNQVIGYIDPSQPGMTYAPNPIRSPIAGTIIALPLDIGTRVASSSVLAQVGNLNSLQIEGFIPERLLGRTALGANVTIHMPAFPDVVSYGKISEIAPAIDVNSRTTLTRIQVSDLPPQMKSGMFVELLIESDRYQDVLVIAQRAVITRGGRYYLFVVSDSEAVAKQRGINVEQRKQAEEEVAPKKGFLAKWKESREEKKRQNMVVTVKDSAPISGWATLIEVELGFSIDGQVVVTQGLEAGDIVIVSGQSDLSNALPVNIVDALEN